MHTVLWSEDSFQKSLSKEYSSWSVQEILETHVAKFAVFNFLEGALQPNLQVTGLAMGIALSGNHSSDYQVVLSLALSLSTAAKAVIMQTLGAYYWWQHVTCCLERESGLTWLNEQLPQKGETICLKSCEQEFRLAFSRFEDDLNGFSEAKLAKLGQEARVVKTYFDGTMTCEFLDLQQMDFPVEAMAGAQAREIKPIKPSLRQRVAGLTQKHHQNFALFMILATADIALLLFAATKMFMALMVCEDGLWNLSFPLPRGCVHLPR